MQDTELRDLLAAMVDDELDTQQWQQLDTMLTTDSATRRAYVEYLALHADLTMAIKTVPQATDLADVEPSAVTSRRRSSGWRIRVSIAAALIIAAAIVAVALLRLESQPLDTDTPTARTPHSVAMLSDLSDDAVFADNQNPMQLGSNLPAGPIHLIAGRAQFMFESNAVVDLTGPCKFEMTGPNRGRLTSGELKAYVPDGAHGFSVDLPDRSRVVDLGTRFELVVDPVTRIAHLRVQAGSVRVEPAEGASMELHSGGWADVLDGHLQSFALTGLHSIDIVNASFESPHTEGVTMLTDAIEPTGVLLGWTIQTDGDIGVFDPKSGNGRFYRTAALVPGVDGQQAAFVLPSQSNTTTIEQRLDTALESGKYRLTVAIGLRNGLDSRQWAPVTLALLAGDQVIASRQFDQPPGPRNVFTDVQLDVTIASDDAHIGLPLTIRFTVDPTGPDHYADFDNVRLTFDPIDRSPSSHQGE